MPTTFYGSQVVPPETGSVSAQPVYVQLFCTVADLIADKQAPGADETRLYGAIREASEFIQKDLGWFIPVTQTLKFDGYGSNILFVPPLLAITSIINDTTTLTTSDYILEPSGGFWPNGPYSRLVVDPYATLLSSWVRRKNGVEITGPWGKYLRSGLIGATVQDTVQQSASATTLKVSDGGKVSPGMVLLIGSEQEAVNGWGSPTAAITQLNGAMTASDETLTVDNGALLNVGEVIRVGWEQMKIKDKQTHQCAIIRGWNGTSRVTHADNSVVDVYRTVNVDRGVNGTAAAAHATNTDISRYFVPDDIKFLCKEIATLIVNKAGSGYQGRTGNQETGVVFYNDAFPEFDIKKIKKNYKIPRLS
jgi:hypothetical protein